jgi:hypothetical protein
MLLVVLIAVLSLVALAVVFGVKEDADKERAKKTEKEKTN